MNKQDFRTGPSLLSALRWQLSVTWTEETKCIVDIIIVSLLLSLSYCYWCVCVWLHMYGTCIGVWVHREARGGHEWFAHLLSYAFKSVTEPGPRLMANKAQGSSCFSPLSTGVVGACGHSRVFTWVLGSEQSVLRWHSKDSYPLNFQQPLWVLFQDRVPFCSPENSPRILHVAWSSLEPEATLLSVPLECWNYKLEPGCLENCYVFIII